MQEEDVSEDSLEVEEAASSEFKRLVDRLKEEEKKAKELAANQPE